ncbi:hypothetical protein HNQ44_001341 [Planomicrobium koreense]|uniref:SWIM-type domain-containing protein n=1 Tax=Planococcus koreensis TaxID=112331 RepID=A0A7W8FUL1_9BACL|nr:SWIM zinc finger family protein [Planococcus koreensis]MBB5179917.1 hypothetical protein [Planococcus koreensis]
MKLNNLKAYVPAKLYTRGVDYFKQGHVKDLTEDAPNRWHALVAGTTDYDVAVNLKKDGNLSSTYCTCPFESDSLCKHEVAVCLAIEAYKKEHPGNKPDVLTRLKALKKAELLEIFEELLQRQPAVNQYLADKFSAPIVMDEIAARHIIQKSVNRTERSGFIEWDRTHDAIEGALEVQEYLSTLIPMKDGETMLTLHLIVIAECTEMLEIADDSSGIIGSVINESLVEIHDIMDKWQDGLDAAKVDWTLGLLYPHILFAIGQDMTDAATELAGSLLQWADQGDYANKIYGFIDKVIASEEMQNRKSDYTEEQFRTYQLAILQQQGDRDAVEAFYAKHHSYSNIRRSQIVQALVAGEFEKVVHLCKVSEQIDSELRGLVRDWKKLRFEAYEGMRNKPGMIELAYEFAAGGDEAYYTKLKNLVSAEQWPAMLEELLEKLKNNGWDKSLYLKILIDEKRDEDLLDYCRANLSEIEKLYPHLLKEYPHEVNEIFTSYIYKLIASASNRKSYYTACTKIRIFQKAAGKEAADVLIDEVKFMYPKRKALLDELAKL